MIQKIRLTTQIKARQAKPGITTNYYLQWYDKRQTERNVEFYLYKTNFSTSPPPSSYIWQSKWYFLISSIRIHNKNIKFRLQHVFYTSWSQPHDFFFFFSVLISSIHTEETLRNFLLVFVADCCSRVDINRNNLSTLMKQLLGNKFRNGSLCFLLASDNQYQKCCIELATTRPCRSNFCFFIDVDTRFHFHFDVYC